MAGNDVIIRFLGETSEFNAKLAETQGKLGAFSQKAEAAGGGFAALGVIALAAVGAIAVASITLADKFDVVHARLETVTKASGENFGQFEGAVKKADDRMAALGFSAIQSEQALGTLTGATHDVGKATSLLGEAADLARFKNISLADASDKLVKIQAGQYRVLKSLGVSTEGLTQDTKGHEEALRRLSEVIKGQATAYTHTLAGEFDIFKAKITNASIAIGEHLIPLINGMIDVIGKGVSGFQTFNEQTGGWAGKLALVATVGPIAALAIARLVSAVQAGIGALASGAESLYLWALYNPLLAAGLAAAAVAAVTFLGIVRLINESQGQVARTAKQWGDQVVATGDGLQTVANKDLLNYIKNTDGAQEAMAGAHLSAQDLSDAVAQGGPKFNSVRDALFGYANSLTGAGAAQKQMKTGDFVQELFTLHNAFVKENPVVQNYGKNLGDLKGKVSGAATAISGAADATAASKVTVSDVNDALSAGKIGWANYSDATKIAADTGATEDVQLQAIAKHLNDIDAAHQSLFKSTLSLDEALHSIGTDEKTVNDAFVKAAQAGFKNAEANDAFRVANDRLLGSIGDIAQKGADVADQYDKMRIAQGSQINEEQQAIDKHNAEALALADLKVLHPELADKIKDTATQLGIANVTTDDAIGKMIAQGVSVDTLKAKFPELSGAIDDYVKNHLDTIPRGPITTDVEVNVFGVDQLNTLNLAIERYTRDKYGAGGIITVGPNAGLPVKPTAVGGIFTSPQVRLIGEAGPEVVLPLKDRKRTAQLLEQSGLAGRPGVLAGAPKLSAVASSSSPTIINLTVNALDPRSAEDGVIKALQGWARRNGPVPVKVAG